MKFRYKEDEVHAHMYAKGIEALMGSPPFSRTLTRRPMQALRSVHFEAKEVQCGVQARCC